MTWVACGSATRGVTAAAVFICELRLIAFAAFMHRCPLSSLSPVSRIARITRARALSFAWLIRKVDKVREKATRHTATRLAGKGVMARQRYLRRCVPSTRRRPVAASVSFSEAPANRWIDSPVYFTSPVAALFSPRTERFRIHSGLHI